MNIHFKR